jgi:F0F1-type ATP synthase beta subunit
MLTLRVQIQGDDDMKNLADKFAEIERRIKKLVDENKTYKKRAREMEKELGQTRNVAQKSAKSRDQQVQLKERIEKILKDLEAVETKTGSE